MANCDVNAICTNTIGSFTCECNDGYTGSGEVCFLDVCGDGAHTCHADAICSNTIDGYVCSCNDGFYGDGTDCDDVDECHEGDHLCGTPHIGEYSVIYINATCVNNYGGYDCECDTGDDGPCSGAFSGVYFDEVGYYCMGKEFDYKETTIIFLVI